MGSEDEFPGFEEFHESTLVSRQSLLKLGLAVPLGAAVLANPRLLEAAQAATPKKPGTLVVADVAVADNIDPDGVNAAFIANQTAVAQLYTQYLRFGLKPNLKSLGGGLRINPSKLYSNLATYKRSLDGKTLTFRLKRGVMSDFGNELTSADAKWAYDRALGHRRTAFFNLRTSGQIVDFNLIDKYTFSFTTSGQNMVTPLLLAFRVTLCPYDSTEAKKHATAADPWADVWLGRNSAGFGPYRIANWTPGQSITFTAREQFPGAKPAFKSVQILNVPVIGDRVAAVEAGDAHIAMGITPLAAGRANAKRNKGKVKAVQFQGNGQVWLVPNWKVPELAVPAVRQAMALAVPYESIIKNVFNGHASIAKTSFYSYLPCKQTKYWRYSTNLAKAKQLMAGRKIGPLDFLYPENRPLMAPLATILQQAFQQIGIETKLVPTPESVAQSRINVQRNIPIYLTDTFNSATPAPQVITASLVTGSATNVANYPNNAPFDKINAMASDTLDIKVVCQAADQFQKLYQETLPLIPLVGFNNLYIMNQHLDNWSWWPDQSPRFQYVSWD